MLLQANIVWEFDVTDVVLKAVSEGIDTVVAVLFWENLFRGGKRRLTFRHRASCTLGQEFHSSPENAFFIFNQQIYFII